MAIHKFIAIKGKEGENTGYFVPHLYKLHFHWRELSHVGLQFVKERVHGWTIWYTVNEADFVEAIKELKKLKKTRIFDFKVSK